MECYDTCCDRGKRCVLPREKICCSDCGKLNPCYNIQSAPCNLCPSKEPYNDNIKKETEKWRETDKWRSNDVCKCKQSCWQWIVSFLGIGGTLPECCRNVRLTAWESGEVARNTLVSKVQQVVNQVSGRAAVQPRSSKVFDKVETKEAEKKTPTAILTSDKEGQNQETSDESPDQLPGKEQGQATADKKKKTRNSSLPRGRTKHRKTGGSKSRSTSRSGKQKGRKGSKTRSGSSSSTSISQGDRKRKRSRSRSGSATKIFNPFKGRLPTSPCNTKSHFCPPLPCLSCSGTQPKAHLSCLTEDRIASFPEKCPSLTHHQPTRCPPRQQSGIRRSNSMSYGTKDTCLRDPEHCYCCTAGASKIPLRSLSFDSTPKRFTSPRPCCLSAQTPLPRSHTWTCSCSMKSDAIMTPYIRGSGVRKASPSFCQSAVRPRTTLCPPSCTKPCCLPISGIHSSQPYTNKHEHRQYTSPTSTVGKASCCAAHNIMKARQNDALCNQLLSKYGYSPPSVRLCPLTCCGCNTTSTCCPTPCLKYGRFPGMGGCVACRPMADYTNCTVCCEQSENYTNSRNPRSPDCHTLKNHLIEFNSSPCEKKPLREFQLPPHCIRDTGPRSPVGEYMAIIRVPKPAKKQEPKEEPAEKPKETEPAPKKEQAEEAKPRKKKSKRISRKSKGRVRNVNENAKSECLNKATSRSLESYVAKQDWPSIQAELVVPSEVSDCSLPHCEESFNNNYGGESYRISRYSSVGPVQIDFSELNIRVNRYPNMPTHSSASSAFVSRYSRPNYPTPSSRCDVRDISSYVSQIYNRDTRTVLDSHCRGGSWTRPTSMATASKVSHKQPEKRPLAFNRSTNSTGLESSDVLNTIKYNVRLETAIENKIRELRDSKVFRSPPARKKMYSNSLFEQMTRAHENNFPTKRNGPQEEFIRESLDQLSERAERRKQDFKYSDAFLNISLPNEASSKQVTQGDVNYQPHIDTSSNKTTTVLYSQNTSNRARETAPVIEVSKPKIDIHHKTHATPRIKKEMVCHFVKDSPEGQTPKYTETGKFENINAAPVANYEPVFQSLIEKFEESAHVYAMSKAEPVPTTGKDFKIKETQPNIFKAFPEGSKDKFMHRNAPAVEWIEENQSSNKADKCLANTRTNVAESSPPHKPIMVKSSEAENTSVCTSSCHINSSGTSSVSLEISRFARCARSSQSLSGSVSGVDTTTFTKVTDVHRNTEGTPTDYSSNVVNRQLLASADLSNTFNKPNDSEYSRVNSETPHSQSKMLAENMSAPSSSGDSGSSVDPICPKRASEIASMTGNSSVDGTNEYHFSKAVTTLHKDVVNKQPEAGDASTFASSTDVDLLPPSQRPASHVKSLTELMREFIRRNGTPV